MSLFRPNYEKEGPGVRKEDAEDHGAKRFCRIYFREFWPLTAMGLLTAVVSLPIVTAPPAWKALNAVTAKLAAGDNAFYFSDYKEAFLKNLPRTIGGGLLLGAAQLACVLAMGFYLRALGGAAGVVLAGLMMSVCIFFTLTAWSFYPLIAREPETKLGPLLKRAFLYGIVGLKANLIALVPLALAAVLLVLLLPFTLPLFPVWFLPLAAFCQAYAIRAVDARLNEK